MIEPTPRPRPTPAQLLAARDATVPDLIRPDLRILFSGINPSLYSAVVGHHFARPGNRFWPALAGAGLTPRQFDPSEGEQLLGLGYGITNVVARATAAADELDPAEFVAGGRILAEKVAAYRPGAVAFLGIMAYRAAFGRPRAAVGLQGETIGPARVWALPSPSGRNGHFTLDPYLELARSLGRP